MGWMFLPVFKAIGEFEASVTRYPNIKPGQEFQGYATGTGSADKVLAQLVPGPFAAITRSVRKTPGRRSASCGARGPSALPAWATRRWWRRPIAMARRHRRYRRGGRSGAGFLAAARNHLEKMTTGLAPGTSL